jgi:hypothetical protein
MNKSDSLIKCCALFLVLCLASGCAAPKPAGLTDPQVTSMTESALKAIDADDYSAFTRDFSEQMLSAFPQAQFTTLQTLLGKASGKFVSSGAISMTNNQGYAVYRLTCKYEKETVYVTVTFLAGGKKVEGLWVDSQGLRKASQ